MLKPNNMFVHHLKYTTTTTTTTHCGGWMQKCGDAQQIYSDIKEELKASGIMLGLSWQ